MTKFTDLLDLAFPRDGRPDTLGDAAKKLTDQLTPQERAVLEKRFQEGAFKMTTQEERHAQAKAVRTKAREEYREFLLQLGGEPMMVGRSINRCKRCRGWTLGEATFSVVVSQILIHDCGTQVDYEAQLECSYCHTVKTVKRYDLPGAELLCDECHGHACKVGSPGPIHVAPALPLWCKQCNIRVTTTTTEREAAAYVCGPICTRCPKALAVELSRAFPALRGAPWDYTRGPNHQRGIVPTGDGPYLIDLATPEEVLAGARETDFWVGFHKGTPRPCTVLLGERPADLELTDFMARPEVIFKPFALELYGAEDGKTFVHSIKNGTNEHRLAEPLPAELFSNAKVHRGLLDTLEFAPLTGAQELTPDAAAQLRKQPYEFPVSRPGMHIVVTVAGPCRNVAMWGRGVTAPFVAASDDDDDESTAGPL